MCVPTWPPVTISSFAPDDPSARTWSAQHVVVRGADGEVTVTSVTPPHERWGLGGGIVSTGSVAAAAVRLLARGELDARGALPPERCLPADALMEEVARVGTSFHVQTKTVSEVP